MVVMIFCGQGPSMKILREAIITNNKALALHSREKRHTKTERKKGEWDKAEGKERVSQNRHTKAEKQRKNNE